jgi:hypothetical protein
MYTDDIHLTVTSLNAALIVFGLPPVKARLDLHQRLPRPQRVGNHLLTPQ